MSPRISLSRTSCAVVRSCGRDSATSKIERKSFSAPSASTGNCSLASSGAPCRAPYRRRPKPDRRKPPTKPSPHFAGGIRPLRVPKVPAETTYYPQVRRTSSPICRSSTLPSILPCTGAGPAPQKCILKSEAQERHPPRINFIHNGPTVSAQGVLAPSFIQAPGSPRQNFPGSPNHGPYTGTREKTLSHPRLKKPPSLRRRAQSFPNCSSVP